MSSATHKTTQGSKHFSETTGSNTRTTVSKPGSKTEEIDKAPKKSGGRGRNAKKASMNSTMMSEAEDQQLSAQLSAQREPSQSVEQEPVQHQT